MFRLLANESLGSRLFQSSSAINQSVICCGSSVNQSTHKLSGCRQFHTSIPRNDENESMPDPETGWPKLKEEKEWLDYNKIVYPPQKPGDPKRPAVSIVVGTYHLILRGRGGTCTLYCSPFYISF